MCLFSFSFYGLYESIALNLNSNFVSGPNFNSGFGFAFISLLAFLFCDAAYCGRGASARLRVRSRIQFQPLSMFSLYSSGTNPGAVWRKVMSVTPLASERRYCRLETTARSRRGPAAGGTATSVTTTDISGEWCRSSSVRRSWKSMVPCSCPIHRQRIPFRSFIVVSSGAWTRIS